LIRTALEQLLADDARASRSLEDAARSSWEPRSPSARAFRFDRWLTDRIGLPRVLVERMIVDGRVQIDGVVCRDLVINNNQAGFRNISVDGDTV